MVMGVALSLLPEGAHLTTRPLGPRGLHSPSVRCGPGAARVLGPPEIFRGCSGRCPPSRCSSPPRHRPIGPRAWAPPRTPGALGPWLPSPDLSRQSRSASRARSSLDIGGGGRGSPQCFPRGPPGPSLQGALLASAVTTSGCSAWRLDEALCQDPWEMGTEVVSGVDWGGVFTPGGGIVTLGEGSPHQGEGSPHQGEGLHTGGGVCGYRALCSAASSRASSSSTGMRSWLGPCGVGAAAALSSVPSPHICGWTIAHVPTAAFPGWGLSHSPPLPQPWVLPGSIDWPVPDTSHKQIHTLSYVWCLAF